MTGRERKKRREEKGREALQADGRKGGRESLSSDVCMFKREE